MAIQNLNSNGNSPKTLSSRSLATRPNQVVQQTAAEPTKTSLNRASTTPLLPLESLKTVLSPSLENKLQSFSKTVNPTKLSNPLQAYQAVTDFVEIDQLSTVIGIDTRV